MSRGPERKEIDWETVNQIIKDKDGLVSTDELRKEYNKKKEDSLSWNTLNARLQDNDGFACKKAGNYNMWTSVSQ